MADKKDNTSSVLDFVANLVSRGDAKGVDSTYGSIVRDKVNKSDLSPEEESVVGKIAKKFGEILKIGAFAEGPEARRNVGTTNVRGTGAIKEKMEGISSGTKSEESGGLSSFLTKLGIAAAVIGGLLLAFKDNEAVQKILTKFGEVFGFLSEKFNQFISIDWDALDLIAIGIGGLVGAAIILALSKLASTLPVAAVGLALLAGSLYLLNKVLPDFEAISWETIGKAGTALGGLGVIGSVLGAIGLGKMVKGALGLTLLSGALFVLAKVLPVYENIDWDTITKAGTALGGLGVIGTIFGKIGLTTLIKGAAGLTILSGALWVLGEKGLKPFIALDWDTLARAGAALLGLGAVGALAGVFAPKLLLGALAIGALGLALIPFAHAVDIAAPGLEKLINAFSNFYGNILEKMPPIIKEIGVIITGVIDSVSTGVNSLIDTLAGGVTRVLDGVKGIIKESGDTIVNIANGVSDSISRFFDRLADTILKLNDVDTTKLKEIGPALSSIGAGLAKFGAGGFFENILSGLGSLFGADSPLEKFQKLGEVAPAIQSIPVSLEALSKYKDLDFLNIDIDDKTASIKDLNTAAWNLKGTLEQLNGITVKKIEIDLTAEKVSVLDKINRALLNLISSTNSLRNSSLANLTDAKELNLFGAFSDNRTVTSINEVNSALLNLLDTQEKLKANSKDLENIKGSFDIKTLNTVSDTNIRNLTTDTKEYHNFAKTAMQEQINRQDVMIGLLRQLIAKPTGSASINTSAPMQQIPNKTFDIRDEFNSYTLLPNNLVTK